MQSWNDLDDADLAQMYDTNWGDKWPAWKIITRMIQHEAYHTGQVNFIRTGCAPVETPPDIDYDNEREILIQFPSW